MNVTKTTRRNPETPDADNALMMMMIMMMSLLLTLTLMLTPLQEGAGGGVPMAEGPARRQRLLGVHAGKLSDGSAAACRSSSSGEPSARTRPAMFWGPAHRSNISTLKFWSKRHV